MVLPAGVEAKSPYLEQVSCDPVIKPGVQAFEQFVLGTWRRGYSGGAVRACGRGGLSEHKEGRAWDWMLNPNNYEDVVAGQRVVDWLLKDDATNARRVGIMYVIWNRRIWARTFAGVKASELERHLRAQIGRLFTNFSLSVSLGQLRSVKVFVVGPAQRPGVYTLPSQATLLSALVAAGGPGPSHNNYLPETKSVSRMRLRM